MVVVGDSLAEGVRSPLTNALSGWTLSTNARVGRPLAEGMGIVRGMSERPPVLAISLFTNDGPGAVDALRSAVRETITRQSGHGCVVWATIVRPAVGGVTYARANQALAELAAENPSVMKLVPWAQQVAAQPEWLGSDGVHATPAGYSARAQMYAEAARSCV
jgi:lysophospholipase L1-like esterase